MEPWPELSLSAWKDTCATLHRYMQIVGKVSLALAPKTNHWWQVAFHLTSRGMTTTPLPYLDEAVQIDFDFIDHELIITTSRGARSILALEPRPVAEFHRDVMSELRNVGVEVDIWDVPVEIPDDHTPFHEDRQHASYDPEHAQRFWRATLSVDAVFKAFRGRFTGKASPVHFFWGSFDLTCSFFSGNPAPERPGADFVEREAYRDETWSAGFWPGSAHVTDASFFAYAAPQPEGFPEAKVCPAGAVYDSGFKQFLLPYAVVRQAADPRAALLEFLQSTYEAAANLGGWNRAALERPLITAPSAREPGRPLAAEQSSSE